MCISPSLLEAYYNGTTGVYSVPPSRHLNPRHAMFPAPLDLRLTTSAPNTRLTGDCKTF